MSIFHDMDGRVVILSLCHWIALFVVEGWELGAFFYDIQKRKVKEGNIREIPCDLDYACL